jgi:type IV pilus assembly protein PilC
LQDHRQWVEQYARQANERRLLWRALSYPLLLLVVCFVAWVFMTVYLLPRFAAFYDEFELKLPPSMSAWIRFSELWRSYPIGLSLVVTIGLVIVIFLAQKFPRFLANNLDVSLFGFVNLHVALIGFYMQSNKSQLLAMSRLTSTLAELLSVGIDLPQAFRIAGVASGNLCFRKHAHLVATRWENEPIKLELRTLPTLFPRTLDLALTAGPARSPSIAMIRTLASVYAERRTNRWAFGRNLMGPICTYVAGILIFGMLSRMYQPILALIRSLAGN